MARAGCSRDCVRALADLSTRNEFGPHGGMYELDAVDTCINNLHEKRRCKREAGLEGLVGLLEGFIPMDRVNYRCLTIFYRCRASINRGSSAMEALLAYRAIGLLALTVGASADCSMEILANTLQLPVPVLVKTLWTSSDAAKVLAALDCLAAVTFAAARRPLDVEPSLGIIWSLIKRARVVSIAAVSLWALLLTTLGHYGTYPYAGKEATIPFRDLAELLDTDDPTLLMASGEALAVCAELGLTRYASPEDMVAFEIKVSDLASGTHGGNKKLNKHRFMFQEIAAIMRRGECSDEELMPTSTSQRSVLKVSKWARLVQLNFLKQFLDKGFNKHLLDNPLFREDFSNVATTEEASDLPTGKIKQCRFGREKQWTVALRRDRMISWEDKNAFQLI